MTTVKNLDRVFNLPVATVYNLYIAKVVRKGQPAQLVQTVTCWLTGFSAAQLQQHLDAGTTFRDFFEAATINENAHLITGKICGVQIEDIEDPLMKKIRYLDKLVDEVASGRKLEKVLRG